MIDCLLVGFNDPEFEPYVKLLRLMGGAESGAYRDLRLAFVEHEGKPWRALEILSRFHAEAHPDDTDHLHNADFLWPVITYLGTYLDRRGFTFDYVNLFHLEKEKLRQKLQSDEVLTVAVTTTLYVTAEPIREIVEFVRTCNEDVKIVIGGPYVANQVKTMDASGLQVLFDSLDGDLFVVGPREGEAALAGALAAMKSGRSLETVPNLAYRDGGTFRFTAAEVESNPLEDNLVDYSLFPTADINHFVTTRTAKSCPFSCAFCGFPLRSGRYTYLSVADVERELDNIAGVGTVSTITFLDDTFNVPKRRFREILEMMIRNEYGFSWNSFYRSDHGDPATIELMREAGCEGVFLGIESGSDEMLERMNKASRRRDYLEALEVFNRTGIQTYASLILGFPGETEETIAATVSLIEEGRPTFYRMQLWYCDPITPIWERRDELGITGSAFNWSHDTMDWRTACEHIERIFCEERESIWLPQMGFEQWATFYLQRRGMPFDQVKAFVRSFNAIVAEQIRDPGAREIPPPLLADLKATCDFELRTLRDAGGRPAPDAIVGGDVVASNAVER